MLWWLRKTVGTVIKHCQPLISSIYLLAILSVLFDIAFLHVYTHFFLLKEINNSLLLLCYNHILELQICFD